MSSQHPAASRQRRKKVFGVDVGGSAREARATKELHNSMCTLHTAGNCRWGLVDPWHGFFGSVELNKSNGKPDLPRSTIMTSFEIRPR